MFNTRKELRASLPRATITRLAEKHKCSRTHIANIIFGRAEDPEILEEIVQIALLHRKEKKKQEKLNEKIRKHLKFKIPKKGKNEQTST